MEAVNKLYNFVASIAQSVKGTPHDATVHHETENSVSMGSIKATS